MGDYMKYIKVVDAVEILLKDCIRYVFPTTAEPTTEFIKLNNAINLLQLYPSEDVAPIVRCKDCKWWTKQEKSIQGRCALTGIYPTGGWYCGNGEREDDE